MKINLELNVLDNGKIFLNFWDYKYGDDVVCEVAGNKLMLQNSPVSTIKQITLQDFINQVMQKASEQ